MTAPEHRPYDPRRDQPQTLGQLAHYTRVSAVSQYASRVPPPVSLATDTVPGLDRLAAFCNAEFGTHLTEEAVLKLRGKYAVARGISTKEADAAPLSDVARILVGPGTSAPEITPDPPRPQEDSAPPLFTEALDRVAVVEDASDEDYLLWWMELILPPHEWQKLCTRGFCIHSERRPTGDEVNQKLKTIKQIHREDRNLQPHAFVIADRDYRSDAELEETTRKLRGKDFQHQTWHVWHRVEIENYLLCIEALVRYVVERTDAKPDEVRHLIEEAIEASRDRARFQLIDSFGRMQKGHTLSVVVRDAEAFLESVWRGEGRIVWCDAKEVVLPRLRQSLKARWNLALSERELIRSLRPEEIPPDMPDTIRRLADFLLGSRWVKVDESKRAELQPLFEAFRNEIPAIRRQAVESLADKGAVGLPILIRALKDDVVEVRREAANTLIRLGEQAAGAAEAIGVALDDQSIEVRDAAARALAGIGPPARAAVPALLEAIEKGNWRIRFEAARALGRIGVADSVVPVLIDVLRDRGVPARDAAAEALGNIGAGAVAAQADLLKALREDDKDVRTQCAEALGKIGSASEEVTAGLLEAVHDGEEPRIRRAAVEAIGRLGVTSAVDMIVAALKDPDSLVRKSCVEALQKLASSTPKRSSGLMSALDDTEPSVRRTAAVALSGVKDASQRLADLARQDQNGLVRVAAAHSLATTGGEIRQIVPVLVECLDHGDDATQKAAAEALGALGPAACDSVSALVTALRSPGWPIRVAAANALGKIGPAAAHAAPFLAAAFADDLKDQWGTRWGDGPVYDYVRFESAVALGKIGRAARETIPALRANHKLQQRVREAAEEAITIIEETG